jgi:hypothetical protein
MTKYIVEEMQSPDDEDEDDPVWDALDWCYLVKNGDDIICICATRAEADHIQALLNEKPYAE